MATKTVKSGQKTSKSKITGSSSKKGSYYGYNPNSSGAKQKRKTVVNEWDEMNKAKAKKRGLA